jgi:cardiolipin synthase
MSTLKLRKKDKGSMKKDGFAKTMIALVSAGILTVIGLTYYIAQFSGSQLRWIILFFLVMGIMGAFAIFFALFSSSGDQPEKRWSTSLPEVHEEEFLTALSRVVNAPVERGKPVKILNNGDDFMPALLEAIRLAQKTVNITVYIWNDGRMSDQIFDAVTERAKAGVRVRILLDGFGGLLAPQNRIEELRHAGGIVAIFRSFHWGKLMRFNRRTHCRAIIIDGKIGFTGGMAVDDQWLGDAKNPDEWRDMMFAVTGRMAQSLQGVFAQLWTGTVGEVLTGQDFYPDIHESDCPSRYISIESSPSSDTEPLEPFYWLSVSVARKTLYLTYPYAAPDHHLRQALMDRAKAGVDVRLLLPAKIDSKITQWASNSYYTAYLKAGIRIYEYKKVVLHSKILTVDGKWSIIGSANLDIRSKTINEENVLGVLDTDLAPRLDKVFFTDLAKAKEVKLDEWGKRGPMPLIFEWFFGVFKKQY